MPAFGRGVPPAAITFLCFCRSDIYLLDLLKNLFHRNIKNLHKLTLAKSLIQLVSWSWLAIPTTTKASVKPRALPSTSKYSHIS